jgi:hypothetical protein
LEYELRHNIVLMLVQRSRGLVQVQLVKTCGRIWRWNIAAIKELVDHG